MGDVVTIDQIRDLIKAEKFKPSDLFGADVLADDPSVKGLIETENRRAVAGEYAHRKRTEEGFDKTKAELERERDALKSERDQLRLAAATGKVGALFDAQKATRKLTEKQATFIKDRLSKFKPTKPEELEAEFSKYLDSEVDEFGKVAKLLGVKDGVAGDDNGGNDKGGATGPEASTPGAGALPENKYVDPTKNPLIKTD